MTDKRDWRSGDDFVDEEKHCREITSRMAGFEPDQSIRLGTSGWSYKDWVGPFYPPGSRQRDFLGIYGKVFNTVEVDSTFYSVPKQAVVESWAARSPEGFIFCPRLPRQLSHETAGLDPRSSLLRLFLDRISLLGDKLGPILIQLPPSFGPEETGYLRHFLQDLPGDFRYAIELRNSGWWTDATLDMLGELNMAWVIGIGATGAPQRPLSCDFTYIRWLGDRRIQEFDRIQIDRDADLAEWARWIESRRERLQRVFGFVNNHYAGHSPAGVLELLKLLDLPVPPLPDSPDDRQGDLFG